MLISIIVPMYNEEDNLQDTFLKIKNEMSNYSWEWELIFVNDGSTDNTWEKVKELSKIEKKIKVAGYTQNQGRGKAIRTGFEAALGDIIVTIDSDLSYDANHIPRMIKELEKNELINSVLVSAYMPGGKVKKVPWFRLLSSKLGNKILKYSFANRIYTSTCIVRAYRKYVIDSLVLESSGKEIHLEILTKMLALGYKIKEIPGILTNRKKGKSKSNLFTIIQSHLKFFAFEKPFILFGMIGIILMLFSIVTGGMLIYRRLLGNIDFGIFSKIITPNVVIILMFVGLSLVGFGFLGVQNNILRNELYKIQSKLKVNKKR